MTEEDKILTFENKLKQLKEEEELLIKLLKGVQSQLKKYEVEELQTCNGLASEENEEENSESDESINDTETLLKILDCAELVNDTDLDLGVNKPNVNSSDEEDGEEFEDSE